MAPRGEKACCFAQNQKITFRRSLPGNILNNHPSSTTLPGSSFSFTMQIHDNSQVIIGDHTFLVESKEVMFEIYDAQKDFYKCILKIQMATRSFDGTLAEKDEFFLMIE